MRTTVTLDPDVESLVRTMMRERGISFKAALNEAIRRGLAAPRAARARSLRLATHRMGWRPELRLDKALAIAAALEDEEIARRLSVRK